MHSAPIAAEIAAATRDLHPWPHKQNDHMVRAHPWSRHSLNLQLKRRRDRQNHHMLGPHMAYPPPVQAKTCRWAARVSTIIRSYGQARSREYPMTRRSCRARVPS